jgi:hypothetical protein
VTTNIGGALLRVLGSADRKQGGPNPASRSDAFDIIDGLMNSKELRLRCNALSTLSQDVPIEARKQACRALLILMISTRTPTEEPPMDHGKTDYSRFRNTTPEYTSMAAPKPNGKWAAHVEANYKKSAAAEFVRVSPYLAELIEAFEALFGIRGALLVA